MRIPECDEVGHLGAILERPLPTNTSWTKV